MKNANDERRRTNLFAIVNTSKTLLYVMAADRREAVGIAWAMGHIRQRNVDLSQLERGNRIDDDSDRSIREIRSSEWRDERVWGCVMQARDAGCVGAVDFHANNVQVRQNIFSFEQQDDKWNSAVSIISAY